MHKRICLAQQKEKLQLGTKQIQELELQEWYSLKNLPARQYIDQVCHENLSTFIDNWKYLF